ncbi:relaxase domain-containing protein [Sulfurovum sp. bin170]|uniref:MobF family relaxase n=1 Tax=Sulfurovum sp. bin170 TaxID=2695268 RepID=UPI0013DE8B06|nr:MobF family relaxase [Sulfurovum sp. bin170]NEW59904.1 relaxase domain-containing protein [Sulfurovum sp. bin170]
MLSISNPQKATQAETYYTKENYYQKNSEKGYFRGSALSEFGINENQTVTQETYLSLLHGFNPKDNRPLTKGAGSTERRAGIDLTFSAPKSVSTLLEIAEANSFDKMAIEIREAHDNAVKQTMEKVEKDYLYTRVSVNGKIQTVKADGMAYASFQHDTSRDLDPQLHTHNFIFTPVLKDGKFNAQTNEAFFNNKLYLGQFYRNELAYNLNKLGFTIEITSIEKGLFELKEVPKDIIDEFSKRSKEIQALEESYKKKYPKKSLVEIKAQITQESKKAKTKIDRDEVRATNKKRADSLGYNKKWLSKLVYRAENRPTLPQDRSKQALNYLNKSLTAITNQESTFSKEDILKYAMKFSLKYSLRESDIVKEFRNSNILKLDKNIYTTKEMIDIEKEIIQKVHQGFSSMPNSLNEIINQEEHQIDKLTSDQKKMLEMILNTKDRYNAVQGDAGTGKTYALGVLKKILKDDIELIGLSYTGKATAGLEEVGIKSHTLHSYLQQERKQNRDKPKLYIVDETSLVGSKQIHQLMKISQKENSRVIFIGDIKQFSSIQAGNAFSDMQKFGIKTVKLKETQRQKSNITKAIVKAYNQGDTDRALELLKENKLFKEIEDYEERIDYIVETYLNKNQPLILTSTNQERKEINHQIRNKLENPNQEHQFTIKESKQIKASNAYFSESYEVDDIISINGAIPKFKRGEQGRVISSDRNILKIETNSKQIKEIDLSKYGTEINAYTQTEKFFKAGEKIIFSKNIKNSPIKNGVMGTITDIENGNITTKLQNGKNYSFSIEDYNYIDYAYAITDIKSQGVSANSVLVLANSRMSSKNSFYVQVTRAKEKIEVVTDNQELLQERIKNPNNKKSTLNYQGEKNGKQPRYNGETRRDREPSAQTEQSNHRAEQRDKYDFRNIRGYIQAIKRRFRRPSLSKVREAFNLSKVQRADKTKRDAVIDKLGSKKQEMGIER